MLLYLLAPALEDLLGVGLQPLVQRAVVLNLPVHDRRLGGQHGTGLECIFYLEGGRELDSGRVRDPGGIKN